ncbi:hypothetical protein MYX82_08765 [Acidobacteria bacterium AH-259-D05]|nr:hypothetical protein [Acidobacteria bacterium AH-259-D05]
MAHPQIAVFARMADGGAKATRAIEGQGTLLGRTMHGIDYDEVNDEIVVPQQFGQAILTFSGGANGEEKPIRVIQGSLTQLKAPDRLAVDPVNDEIFIPEGDKILVFPRKAHGNVAPIRVIQGPDTQLGARSMAVDPVNDLLVVAGDQRRGERGQGHLLIFNRTDAGNVKPRAVISGPKTLLTSVRNVRVYPPNGWILVAEDGVQSNQGGNRDQDAGIASFVAVFSIHDNGNVAPRWTIGGPDGRLRKPRGIALDPENKAVIISDKYLNAVLTYSLPEMYE